MKDYQKLKVCFIKAGEVTTELPDDFLFEKSVLKGLSQGQKQRIKKISLANGEVFLMAWRNVNDTKIQFEPQHISQLSPSTLAKLMDEQSWFVMDFVFEVQLKYLKKIAMK